jgi:hypothetical protein
VLSNIWTNIIISTSNLWGAARITNYKAILSQLSAVFPLTIPKPNDHRHVHAFI